MLADLLTAEVARIGCFRATLHIYSCIPEELPTKGNSQQVKNPAGAGLAYRRFSDKLDDIQLRLSYWSVPTSSRRHRFATMHSDAVTLSLAFQATGLIFSSRSSWIASALCTRPTLEAETLRPGMSHLEL